MLMSPPVLGWDQTLFKDPEVFETAYLPETFRFREMQMEELACCLLPGLRGGSPSNAVLQGRPGTGKTTAVKKVFSQVEASTQRLLPVMVNCQTDYTKYAVFTRIHERLFRHAPRRTSTPFHDLVNTIGRTLAERDVALAVCLDDANVLLDNGTLNTVLYLVLRLHEFVPHARSGVLLVLSGREVDLARDLRPDVLSSLHPSRTYFPPYDEDEIRSILADRVRQGLYPGVLAPSALDQAVARTLDAGGDVRTGLELLKQAALAAEADARMEVCEEDVAAAYATSRDHRLGPVVQGLSAEERRLLSTIAALQAKDRRPLSSVPLLRHIRREKTLSDRAFSRALKKLDGLRVIDLYSCRDGTTAQVIALRYDPLRVMQACGLR